MTMTASSRYSPWLRKPLAVVYQQEAAADAATASNNLPARHMNLMDLIAIGVGGTVGSGIFVLTGQIAAQYAGPSTFLSFAAAGLAACCSGVCYAELSGRIPAAGSTYVYAYICIGELAAVVAAACLTLEYGISGAAVARSWGDKVLLWLEQGAGWTSAPAWLVPGGIQLPAMAVSAASTAILYAGVNESKHVTSGITALKMVIVVFMIVGGFCLFEPKNMQPPLMPFGLKGVCRGATVSFFGYLGYDEVCAVAGEALHPARDMPRAVLGTLLIVTVCYILAAVALTGMVPYSDISPTSGFPEAFSTRGLEWAAQLTAIGEVVTLPVVVMVSLLAQPRLTLSMAHDGLLPETFARVDPVSGTIKSGTLVSGTIMTVVAGFVPFTYLNDLISAGILVAFSMTNSCLILLRCEAPVERPKLLETSLLAYNGLCFLTALLSSHQVSGLSAMQPTLTTISALATVSCLFYMAQRCPLSLHFGGNVLLRTESLLVPGSEHEEFFKTPGVPYLPAFGIFVNWVLIAQLDVSGMLYLAVYVGLTVCVYLFGCAPYSVGHTRGWRQGAYEAVSSQEGGTGIESSYHLRPLHEEKKENGTTA